MVETLDGAATKNKILGILARSILRAASRLTLRVHGALLLAVRSLDAAESPPPTAQQEGLAVSVAGEGEPRFAIPALPGTKLRMVLLHPHRPAAAGGGGRPKLTLGDSRDGLRLLWPDEQPHAPPAAAAVGVAAVGGAVGGGAVGGGAVGGGAVRTEPSDDWELVDATEAAAGATAGGGVDAAAAAVSSLRAKLSATETQHALKHLPMLEPAYHRAGSVHLPPLTEKHRQLACLRTSLIGQLVAPSVTKGCAVATLETQLAPVPEDCRPKGGPLAPAYRGIVYDDEEAYRKQYQQQYNQDDWFGGMGGGPFRAMGGGGGGMGGGTLRSVRKCAAAGGMGGGMGGATFGATGGGMGGGMGAAAASGFAAFGAPTPPCPPSGCPPPAPKPCCAPRCGAPPPSRRGAPVPPPRPSGPPTVVEWLLHKMRGGLFAAFVPSVPAGPLSAGTPPSVRLTREALKKQLVQLTSNLKFQSPAPPASATATAMDAIDTVSSARSELSAMATLPWTALQSSGSVARAGRVHQPDLRQHALRLLECAVVLLADAAPADGGTPASTAFVAWSHLPATGPVELIGALEAAAWRLKTLDVGMVGVAASTPPWPWLGASQPASSQPASSQPASSQPALVASVGAAVVPSTPVGDAAAFVASPLSAQEHADRAPQCGLFTPAVRRGIYAVLLNPHEPGAPVAAPSAEAAAAAAAGRVPFEVLLLGKASTPGHGADTFLFADRARVSTHTTAGFAPLEDGVLLNAIAKIGSLEPACLAATKAFEEYLANRAKAYTDHSIAHLPVEFLVAFGAELTPRLNVDHRARTTTLSEAELRTLTSPPFANFVNQSNLRSFQTLPAP